MEQMGKGETRKIKFPLNVVTEVLFLLAGVSVDPHPATFLSTAGMLC